MEALLKVLIDERRRTGNTKIDISIDLYNQLLDAWVCAALFRTVPNSVQASQRAREILVTLQNSYERHGNSSSTIETQPPPPQPNAESFRLVLHVVSRVEGALTARRLLAWMEYLHKSGTNPHAEPHRSHYIRVLEAYARLGPKSGVLAEAFLRHMQFQGQPVDALCYNIAIKAWVAVGRRCNTRREAAEHADRILDEMKLAGSDLCRPDLVTYACKWESW